MKTKDDVKVLLEGLDETNISSVLTKWKEISEVRKSLDELEEMLRNKVKVYLKERLWDRFTDNETKISATIIIQKNENVDKKQLKMILTDNQYASVVSTTTFEKLLIVTPEGKERLRKYAK